MNANNSKNIREYKLKMLLHRSKNRGCKETDIILGNFAEGMLHKLSSKELEDYEKIIDMPDTDIYKEVFKEEPVIKLLKKIADYQMKSVEKKF